MLPGSEAFLLLLQQHLSPIRVDNVEPFKLLTFWIFFPMLIGLNRSQFAFRGETLIGLTFTPA
jgi:hypothetical protein